MHTTRYTIQGVEHIWKTDNKISVEDVLLLDNQEQQKYRDILDMLQYWIEIAKQYNIKWFSICGTLLGAVRNKGIIPYDDDADVGILLKDYNTLKKIIKTQKNKQFYITRADVGFRIFKTGNRYPFVDIWVFDNCKQNKAKLIYACPFKEDKPTYYASIYLDNEYILAKDIIDLEWVKFENLKIPIIKNASNYLTRAYGNNCLTTYVGEPVKNIHLIIEKMPFYEITQIFFKICDCLKLDDNKNIKEHFSCFLIQIMFLLLRDFNRNPEYMYNRIQRIYDDYTENM